ncbi:hypothetical protein AAVH_29219, partial [Aphelenchoides avenae]
GNNSFKKDGGVCQIDEVAVEDVRKRLPEAKKAALKAKLGIDIDKLDRAKSDLRDVLVNLIVARAYYYIRPGRISKDVEAQGRYYKKWFNTKAGAATLDDWKKDMKSLPKRTIDDVRRSERRHVARSASLVPKVAPILGRPVQKRKADAVRRNAPAPKVSRRTTPGGSSGGGSGDIGFSIAKRLSRFVSSLAVGRKRSASSAHGSTSAKRFKRHVFDSDSDRESEEHEDPLDNENSDQHEFESDDVISEKEASVDDENEGVESEAEGERTESQGDHSEVEDGASGDEQIEDDGHEQEVDESEPDDADSTDGHSLEGEKSDADGTNDAKSEEKDESGESEQEVNESESDDADSMDSRSLEGDKSEGDGREYEVDDSDADDAWNRDSHSEKSDADATDNANFEGEDNKCYAEP